MPNYKLTVHPTPAAVQFNFTFSSFEEMKRYIEYENTYTQTERSLYEAAMTKNQRDEAAETLAKKRRAVYKMWKERNQPSRGDAA